MALLSVSKSAVEKWTKHACQAEKEAQQDLAWDLWIKAPLATRHPLTVNSRYEANLSNRCMPCRKNWTLVAAGWRSVLARIASTIAAL